MKSNLITALLFTMCSLGVSIAQELAPGSKLFLTYAMTDSEGNVDGEDAKVMLKDYIVGKTKCIVVDTASDADFTVELRVIRKGMGNRRAMIAIKNNSSGDEVFKSKWTKGTSNLHYAYSGTRHAIGRIVKGELLKKYPVIKI